MRLFLNWVYRGRPSVHHSVANLARIDRLMATVMKRGALLFCFSASIASACAHNEARIKMCNAADRRNKIESNLELLTACLVLEMTNEPLFFKRFDSISVSCFWCLSSIWWSLELLMPCDHVLTWTVSKCGEENESRVLEVFFYGSNRLIKGFARFLIYERTTFA